MIGRLFRFAGVRGYGSPVHTASDAAGGEAGRGRSTPGAGVDRARPGPADRARHRRRAQGGSRLVARSAVRAAQAVRPPRDDGRRHAAGRRGRARGPGASRRVRPDRVRPARRARCCRATCRTWPRLSACPTCRSGRPTACAPTRVGNPRHLLALLAELPVEAWSREPVLPAPRLFSRSVGRTLKLVFGRDAPTRRSGVGAGRARRPGDRGGDRRRGRAARRAGGGVRCRPLAVPSAGRGPGV